MRIAIIGGGASGMATAYWLDKQGHHLTVFERQPILGGHIRTLNKNVQPNRADCDEVLEYSEPLTPEETYLQLKRLIQSKYGELKDEKL